VLEKAGIIDDEEDEKEKKSEAAAPAKKAEDNSDFFSADPPDPKPISVADAVAMQEAKHTKKAEDDEYPLLM
jgi:hypothetical protein